MTTRHLKNPTNPSNLLKVAKAAQPRPGGRAPAVPAVPQAQGMLTLLHRLDSAAFCCSHALRFLLSTWKAIPNNAFNTFLCLHQKLESQVVDHCFRGQECSCKQRPNGFMQLQDGWHQATVQQSCVILMYNGSVPCQYCIGCILIHPYASRQTTNNSKRAFFITTLVCDAFVGIV